MKREMTKAELIEALKGKIKRAKPPVNGLFHYFFCFTCWVIRRIPRNRGMPPTTSQNPVSSPASKAKSPVPKLITYSIPNIKAPTKAVTNPPNYQTNT